MSNHDLAPSHLPAMKLRNYLYLRSDVAGDQTQRLLGEMRKHLHAKGIGQCTEIIANGPAGFNTVYHTVDGSCPTLVLIPSLPHLQGRLDELRRATHVQAVDTQIIWGATASVVVESTQRPAEKSAADMALTALMQAEVDAAGAAVRGLDGRAVLGR